MPKLPRPKDLQPFPSTESIVRTIAYVHLALKDRPELRSTCIAVSKLKSEHKYDI